MAVSLLKGNKPTDLILVPAKIQRYDELEQLLQAIRPVTTVTTTPFAKLNRFLPFLVIVLLICVYVATNKIIVAISGPLLVGILGRILYQASRSKNIDRTSKRQLLWTYVVLASVIGATIIKLVA